MPWIRCTKCGMRWEHEYTSIVPPLTPTKMSPETLLSPARSRQLTTAVATMVSTGLDTHTAIKFILDEQREDWVKARNPEELDAAIQRIQMIQAWAQLYLRV